MSPRQEFDRFMVAVRHGTNFKIAKFSHASYRAFFSAVIPIAALSDVRGAFMVGDQPATVEDMRIIAPTLTAAECRAALKTLRDAGILEHDAELGGEWVHDFEQWNPEPKKDSTNADRQARYRARQKASRNAVTTGVTDPVTNGAVTPPEVEVEGEVEVTPNPSTSSELDRARAETDLFAYWQQKTGHDSAKFTADRRAKVRARLREGYTPDQIRTAIDGAARAPFVNDQGKRFDDLELICRNGSKLEGFIGRATAVPSIPSGRRPSGPTAEDFLAAGGGTP